MKSFYLLFLLMFVVTSCSNEKIPNPDSNPGIKKIRTELKQTLLKHGIPGAVVAVFDGENETFITEGYADIEKLTPINEDMKFRIASNTKTFTARRILQLIEEGRLNLGDKLITLLPGCGIKYADSISVKQLLNHTSGIANYNGQSAFTKTWFTNPLYKWSAEEILNIIRNSTPDFLPGTPGAWKYSDSNYYLLGLIIEKITNNSARNEITDNVIKPLGLSNTSFPATPEMPEVYCTGYKFDADKKSLVSAININPAAPWTAGAIVSNVSDLGKWVKELGSGSRLTEKMRRECFNFVPFAPGSHYAYGLGVMQITGGLRGHTGMIQGYESCMLYSPEKDAGIVVFFNRCNEDQGIQPAVLLCFNSFKILYPELFEG